MGVKRYQDISSDQRIAEVRWLESIESAGQSGSLCVIATQAKDRGLRLKEVHERLGYSSFILEKLVGQSFSEIKELDLYCSKNGLAVWVNCQGRTFSFHQRLKGKLSDEDNLTISVIGGNLGLANNGIHHVDLFAFLTNATEVKSSGSTLDDALYPSKRAPDMYELSGTINAITDKGSRLSISYSPEHASYEHFSIATRNYRCVVDQLQGWAVESDEQADWVWRPVEYDADVLVSKSTINIASDILSSGNCELPTLKDSLVSHEFIFKELLPQYRKLIGNHISSCPVT